MNALVLITATLILLAGVIDDLRSRKVHNWLFVACAIAAFAVSIAVGGVGGIHKGILGFTAGFAVLLPLVLMNVIGAGDMKLFAAFGTVVGWAIVIDVAIYSLIWGAVFGLIQVIVKGQLRSTLSNLVAITSMKKPEAATLHKMPFTIALMVGWLTELVYKGAL